MSDLIARYGSGHERYLSIFARFAEKLVKESNTKVVLIPHVTNPSLGGGDDEGICRQVAERLKDKDRVVLIGDKLNAPQTKYVISQCDYFIGARTHSTIASLSTCVPTLSIAYSRKAYGLNRQIFGSNDYVLSITDLGEVTLMEKFRLICDRREEIVRNLERRMEELKGTANLCGKYLSEVLRKHGLDG